MHFPPSPTENSRSPSIRHDVFPVPCLRGLPLGQPFRLCPVYYMGDLRGGVIARITWRIVAPVSPGPTRWEDKVAWDPGSDRWVVDGWPCYLLRMCCWVEGRVELGGQRVAQEFISARGVFASRSLTTDSRDARPLVEMMVTSSKKNLSLTWINNTYLRMTF